MATQTKEILKTWFETGDIPSQEQFEHLIDSIQAPIEDSNVLKFIYDVAVGNSKSYSVGFNDIKVGYSNPSMEMRYYAFGYPTNYGKLFGLFFGTQEGDNEWDFRPKLSIILVRDHSDLDPGIYYLPEPINIDSTPFNMGTFRAQLENSITQLEQGDGVKLDIPYTTIVNNLNTTYVGAALDAYQGKVLNDKINAIPKYDYIVTPANWKTVLQEYRTTSDPYNGSAPKSLLFTPGNYNILQSEVPRLWMYNINHVVGQGDVYINVTMTQPMTQRSTTGYIDNVEDALYVAFFSFAKNCKIENIKFQLTFNSTLSGTSSNIRISSLFSLHDGADEEDPRFIKFDNCEFKLYIQATGSYSHISLFYIPASIKRLRNSNLNIENCKFIYKILADVSTIYTRCIWSPTGSTYGSPSHTVCLKNCNIIHEPVNYYNRAGFKFINHNSGLICLYDCKFDFWNGEHRPISLNASFKIKNCQFNHTNDETQDDSLSTIYISNANSLLTGSYIKDCFSKSNGTYKHPVFVYCNSLQPYVRFENLFHVGRGISAETSFYNCMNMKNCNGSLYTNCYSSTSFTSTYAAANSLNGGWNMTNSFRYIDI